MKAHQLKTWPKYFQAVIDVQKRFDLRKNDRDFEVGDILILREYVVTWPDGTEGFYTGREATCKITFILSGEEFGLIAGYVCMSIGLLEVTHK